MMASQIAQLEAAAAAQAVVPAAGARAVSPVVRPPPTLRRSARDSRPPVRYEPE